MQQLDLISIGVWFWGTAEKKFNVNGSSEITPRTERVKIKIEGSVKISKSFDTLCAELRWEIFFEQIFPWPVDSWGID